MQFGPARLLAAGLDDHHRERARTAIARAYADHVDEHGHVVLDAVVGIVTARRGGA